ncbi:MAG: hypothetical protein JO104_12430 [Candidatus Eremiobacteraeota bacterium]|nr:hypothetical protein [Candidatus Eremiobacteraeota bacterium]
MNRFCLFLTLAIASAFPIATRCATVDPETIPNGTYTVKVVKVVDSKHVEVTMDSGANATLPSGRTTVDFSKVQTNDQLKLSIINGEVVVFLDLTSH